MPEGNRRAVAIISGILLVVIGAWVLFGIYPFTGEQFGMPVWRGIGSAMGFFWWFIFKAGFGVALPLFGLWLIWKGFTD